jgi:hypothetical protein
MEHFESSGKTEFRDEHYNTRLARYEIKYIPSFWIYKYEYELEVFSDKFPDAVYFMAIAARDHSVP